MSPPIELTSVPSWAVAPSVPPADLTGTTFSVFAFGDAAEQVVDAWVGALAPSPVAVHHPSGTGAADLDADLATARVGWRAMLVGPLVEVLTLRAHALAKGLADDEIVVATTSTSLRPVRCVHCAADTVTTAGIGETTTCVCCGLELLVYHHVSRLQGVFLGFQVDAERWEGPT